MIISNASNVTLNWEVQTENGTIASGTVPSGSWEQPTIAQNGVEVAMILNGDNTGALGTYFACVTYIEESQMTITTPY